MDFKELEKIPRQIQALKNGVKLLVILMEEIHRKVEENQRKVEELSQPKAAGPGPCWPKETKEKRAPLMMFKINRSREPFFKEEQEVLKASFLNFINRLSYNHRRSEEVIKEELRELFF